MVAFTIVFFLSLWAIDLSVTAMLNPGMLLTNGLVAREPVQVYHMALMMAGISVFLLCIICIDATNANPLIKPITRLKQ